MLLETKVRRGKALLNALGRSFEADISVQILGKQRRIGTEQGGTKYFLGMFGARSFFGNTNTIFYGSAREVDTEIIREVSARVARSRGVVKILEVGAGTSWGLLTRHQGAPWLSRAISSALGSKVSCLVTDGSSGFESHFFFRLPTGELFSHTLEGVRFDSQFSSSALKGAGTRLRFLPFGERMLSDRNPFRRTKAGRDIYEILEVYLDPESITKGSLYIRPQLDAEFELARFGLSTRAAVNYFDPQKTLGSEKFDLIFARHLYPMDQRERTRISRALQARLEPGGALLLEFDGSGLHRQHSA